LRCSLGLESVFYRLDCKSIHVGVRKYKCMRGLKTAGTSSERRVIPAVLLKIFSYETNLLQVVSTMIYKE